MKRLYIGAILAGVTSAAGACKGDPTSSLRNGPAALSVTPSVVVSDPGTDTPVLVVVRDGQLNPVAADVAATSADQTLATVAGDASRPFIDAATHAFVVTTPATALDGGTTTVSFKAGALDTALVVELNPQEFPGAISTLTPRGGDTMTIAATSLLKLDQVGSVTFGGGKGATVLSATTSTVKMLVPFSNADVLTISGVYPTYMSSDFTFDLPSVSTVTQTGNLWAGDSIDATVPTLVLPASTKSGKMITTLYGGTNGGACVDPTAQAPCMFYQFTLADTSTIKFSVDWDGTPADSTRMTLIGCPAPYNAVTCLATPEVRDTTSKKPFRPTKFTFKFAAGTHLIILERKSTATTGPPTGPTKAPRNFRWTITRS